MGSSGHTEDTQTHTMLQAIGRQIPTLCRCQRAAVICIQPVYSEVLWVVAGHDDDDAHHQIKICTTGKLIVDLAPVGIQSGDKHITVALQL